MKPVYFFGTRAKELAKRLHPVTNTRCLDLWTDGAEHYYLRTMRACGNRWRLHSFLLLPDWRIKAKNNHAQKPHHLDNLLLEGLAIFGGFIFMSLVPLGGYAVLAGATYYAAEILDWGWLLAILFVFPGIGFMLLAGAGSLFSVLANKFRASRH